MLFYDRVSKTNGKKYAIIIGAMKSDTTSLFRYFMQHPDIPGFWEKEPQLFSDPKKVKGGLIANNRLWLLKSTGKKVLFEASTGDTKYPSIQDISKTIAIALCDYLGLGVYRIELTLIVHFPHPIS